MASKDRILRLKEETRNNILEASYAIVKEEGWQGLNMRKIAERIEYTAPIIYEYFANKDAIIKELTSRGFVKLYHKLLDAQSKFEKPEEQLEALWMAYWNFAFEDTQVYQVMYGVEMNCCANECSTVAAPYRLFTDVISKVMAKSNPSIQEIKQKYYSFYAVIHGLISINIINQYNVTDDINKAVLKDAIGGIIKSIQKQ